jgi:hypothetical protein
VLLLEPAPLLSKASFQTTGANRTKARSAVKTIASTFTTGSLSVTLLLLFRFKSINKTTVNTSAGINLNGRLKALQFRSTTAKLAMRATAAKISQMNEKSKFKRQFTWVIQSRLET